MTVARSEQEVARVVSTTSPNARAEQVTARMVSANFLYARAEQVVARMVSTNVDDDVTGGRPVVFVVT